MLGKGRPKAAWFCKTCKGKNGKPWENFGFRDKCMLCTLDKGVCSGGKMGTPAVGTRGGPAASAGGTLAERQSRAKKDDNSNRKVVAGRELERANKELLRANKELEEKLANANRATSEAAGAAMDVEADSGGMEELNAAVAEATKKLANVKQTPENIRDLLPGGYEACCCEMQRVLEEAKAARRAKNPLKQQLASAQLHRDNLGKKLDKAKLSLQPRLDFTAALRESSFAEDTSHLGSAQPRW
jgi:hypothetical protein